MEMLFSKVSISREEVFCLLGRVSSPSHSFDFPSSCTVSSLKRWNAFQVGLMTVIYPASVGSVSQVAATWEKRSASCEQNFKQGENAGWLEAFWYVLASSQTPCLWWWWAWRRMLRWCRRKRKMADWSWWRMERWWQGNCESGYEMCFFLRKSRKIMNERNMAMITMMRMINEWKAVTYQRPGNWVVWDLAQLEHSWWCGGRVLWRRFHDWSLDL